MPKGIQINQTFDFTGGEAVVERLHRFVAGLQWEDTQEDARHRVRNLFLDLTGVLACGSMIPVSRIIRDVAVEQFGPSATARARLLLDGREVLPGGAALAIGMSIDSIDTRAPSLRSPYARRCWRPRRLWRRR